MYVRQVHNDRENPRSTLNYPGPEAAFGRMVSTRHYTTFRRPLVAGVANAKRNCDDAGVTSFGESSRTVVLELLAMAIPDLACTVVYPTVNVGQNFKVKVSGFRGPVAGLKVGLYVAAVPKAEVVTDKEGIAQFRNMQPGSYFLSADHDAGMADTVAL